jgi:hypothetical protein
MSSHVPGHRRACNRRAWNRRVTIAACPAVFLAVVTAARAERIYGITYTSETAPQTLVFFDSASPGAVTTVGPLTGLAPGQVAVAMDFRPATGQLFVGAGAAGPPAGPGARLYIADLSTGALTPRGPAFDPLGVGVPSFDFDPVADELRVLTTPTDTRGPTNSRYHPDTNALIALEADARFAPGDPNAIVDPPVPIGAAYSNNLPGATSTTLYTYEMETDVFATVGGIGGSPSPNGGRMSTVGESGFVVPGSFDAFGFDISGPSGAAYVSSFAVGLTGVHLFTVDLATGRMLDAGAVGTPAGTGLLDISAAPAVPEPAALSVLALAGAGLLLRRSRVLRER